MDSPHFSDHNASYSWFLSLKDGQTVVTSFISGTTCISLTTSSVPLFFPYSYAHSPILLCIQTPRYYVSVSHHSYRLVGTSVFFVLSRDVTGIISHPLESGLSITSCSLVWETTCTAHRPHSESNSFSSVRRSMGVFGHSANYALPHQDLYLACVDFCFVTIDSGDRYFTRSNSFLSNQWQ